MVFFPSANDRLKRKLARRLKARGRPKKKTMCDMKEVTMQFLTGVLPFYSARTLSEKAWRPGTAQCLASDIMRFGAEEGCRHTYELMLVLKAVINTYERMKPIYEKMPKRPAMTCPLSVDCARLRGTLSLRAARRHGDVRARCGEAKLAGAVERLLRHAYYCHGDDHERAFVPPRDSVGDNGVKALKVLWSSVDRERRERLLLSACQRFQLEIVFEIAPLLVLAFGCRPADVVQCVSENALVEVSYEALCGPLIDDATGDFFGDYGLLELHPPPDGWGASAECVQHGWIVLRKAFLDTMSVIDRKSVV